MLLTAMRPERWSREAKNFANIYNVKPAEATIMMAFSVETLGASRLRPHSPHTSSFEPVPICQCTTSCHKQDTRPGHKAVHTARTHGQDTRQSSSERSLGAGVEAGVGASVGAGVEAGRQGGREVG